MNVLTARGVCCTGRLTEHLRVVNPEWVFLISRRRRVARIQEGKEAGCTRWKSVCCSQRPICVTLGTFNIAKGEREKAEKKMAVMLHCLKK